MGVEMNFEFITFEAIDEYGCSHQGSLVIDLLKDIHEQVSHYLSINVRVTKYRESLSDNFYNF